MSNEPSGRDEDAMERGAPDRPRPSPRAADKSNRSPASDQVKGPHQIADEPVDAPQTRPPQTHSPVTSTGLPVEEQVEKEWDPNKDGGLPTFLRSDRR